MFPLYLNFLEEISSLSHSIIFLYFFALIIEEDFLISPCYSLEHCIQMGTSLLYSFAFASLLFRAICKASSDSHFVFLHFFFLGMLLIPVSCTMSRTSVHSSSGTLCEYKIMFATHWTVAHQAPLSMRFFKQGYWSDCHVLLQGISPTKGLNPHFLCLLHSWRILYLLNHRGIPTTL